MKGVSKAGKSCAKLVFVDGGKLKADLGRARAIELPREETERRWQITTPQWPMIHAVLYGVTRDQLMGAQGATSPGGVAPDAAAADSLALAGKAAMFATVQLQTLLPRIRFHSTSVRLERSDYLAR